MGEFKRDLKTIYTRTVNTLRRDRVEFVIETVIDNKKVIVVKLSRRVKRVHYIAYFYEHLTQEMKDWEDVIVLTEIENTDNYVFSGTITTSNYPEKLTFYFDRVSGKSIFIKIHKNIGWRDVDLALAKLKFISPDLIQITFTKGFEQDNYQPEFPYKTLIWPFAQYLIVE